jgi:hypothetical protein
LGTKQNLKFHAGVKVLEALDIERFNISAIIPSGKRSDGVNAGRRPPFQAG